jgi:hypothetical protein
MRHQVVPGSTCPHCSRRMKAFGMGVRVVTARGIYCAYLCFIVAVLLLVSAWECH